MRRTLFVWLRCPLAVAGLLAALTLSVPATAQMPPLLGGSGAPSTTAAAPPPSAEEIERLAKTLEDPEQRAALIRQIRLLAEANRPAQPAEQPRQGFVGRVLAGISGSASGIGDALDEVAGQFAGAPGLAQWLSLEAGDPARRATWLSAALAAAIALAGAVAAELAVRWILAGPAGRMRAWAPPTAALLVVAALGRMVLALVPVLAFAAAAFLVLTLDTASPDARRLAGVALQGIVVARLVIAAASGLLRRERRPDRPQLLSADAAETWLRWVRRLAVVGVFGFTVLELVAAAGAPNAAVAVGEKIWLALLAVVLAWAILANRARVAAWMRGRPPGPGPGARAAAALRAVAAAVWHVPALLFVVVLLLAALLDPGDALPHVLAAGFWTVIVLAGGGVLYCLLIALMARAGAPVVAVDAEDEIEHADVAPDRRATIVQSAVAAVLVASGAVLVLEVWGVEVVSWFRRAVGPEIAGDVVTVLIIVFAAYLLLQLIGRTIDRGLQRLEGADYTRASAVRLRTVLPLLRTVALIVVTVFAALLILSEIGVDTAPLIAGVGIIGIAVAFGANALVKDVITGLFILAEGAINQGEVVEVDGRAGVVEALNIRTVRLRDLTGSVHTIPFSNVTSIKNMTRDFSFYLIDARVAYDSDTDRVVEVMREVDRDLRSDPAIGPTITAPLEVLGVDSFGDSAIVVRARIRTLPGKQWTAGREYNRRMKKAFDIAGIEIPFPQRTVHMRAPRAPDGAIPLAGSPPAALPPPESGAEPRTA